MKLASVLGLCLTVLVALAAGGVSAQTTTNSATPTVSASPATTTGTPVVRNLVEITRLVPTGTTAVTAFTVPAGQTLIVTDVLVTNTGAAATCGAAINRAGGAAAAAVTAPATAGTTSTTAGTTSTTAGTAPTGTASASAGTITQSDSSITGPLCVASRTTTPLPLTTGIEFGPGQTVQLMNVPDATTPAGTAATAGAVGFHLRGMLVAS